MSKEKICACLTHAPGQVNPQAVQMAPQASIIIESLWPNGSTIDISFLNGTAAQQKFVRDVANQWVDVVNLKFNWVAANGFCRILFGENGSYSYLGKFCKNIKTGPTMEYGWLDEEVVLHEFYHLLGGEHGQNAPNFPYTWERQVVIDYFTGPPNNWNLEDIEYNVFQKSKHTNYSIFDPESIGQYYFPARFFKERVELKPAGKISKGDKDYMGGRCYPFPAKPVPVPPPPPPPAIPANVLAPGKQLKGRAPNMVTVEIAKAGVYLFPVSGSGLRITVNGKLGTRHSLPAGQHQIRLYGAGNYTIGCTRTA